MSEVLQLSGNCKITQNGETRTAKIVIDLVELEILIQGDLGLRLVLDPDEVYSREVTVPEVQLFTPYGTLHGELGPVRIVGFQPRGMSAHYSGSQLAQLLNRAPHFNDDTLRVLTATSLLQFTLKEAFISSRLPSLLDRFLSIFKKQPSATKFLRNEVWFASPKRGLITEQNVRFGDKVCQITSEKGALFVSSLQPITEHEAECFRACFSLYFGAETPYLFHVNDDRVYINLVEDEVKRTLSPIPFESLQPLVESFMAYAVPLSTAELEQMQNQLAFYLSGRGARVNMNARLAMLFVAIESCFTGDPGSIMSTKIRNLFNLDNRLSPGYAERTVSNSMDANAAGALARIRNLIIHEGFMAERLEEHCAAHDILSDRNVRRMCRDSAIPLWKFLLSNLDKYWLNRIRYRGTFLDVYDDMREVQTLR